MIGLALMARRIARVRNSVLIYTDSTFCPFCYEYNAILREIEAGKYLTGASGLI